jgi:CysZ protein
MILAAVFAAMRQVLSAPLRRIVLRSLGLTVVLLVAVWALLTKGLDLLLVAHPVSADYPLLNTLLYFAGGAGLLVLLVFLLPPVSAVVGGFFLDDAAEIVERTDFPQDPPGTAMSTTSAILGGLRFAGLALLLNLAALTLIFVPIVNVAAFFVVNTYLLGREYFEMAAARFTTPRAARELRRRHRIRVLSAGAVLAALMLVPILNLLTPVFGIALMVHVHKQAAARERSIGRRPA